MQDSQYIAPPVSCADELLERAREYLLVLRREGRTVPVESRVTQIRQEIRQTGLYSQTSEELAVGAGLAWRNSNRCIGRLYWRSLQVSDQRHLTSPEEIFDACVGHLHGATNGGRIRPLMSVFAPRRPGERGIRIWNYQLIRYAGYRNARGNVTGDPAEVELTRLCMDMGWRGPGGRFDVMPLLIDVPGYPLRLFELPADAVLEVPIHHPDYAWFAELGLRWHAVPVVSNMAFVCGGLQYTAAPFSGWYMSTEIGSRNLGDEERYNLLPTIGERLGLNVRRDRSLWKDRALVELNIAVLHSFEKRGVLVLDHHAAARHFMRHVARESEAGREVQGDWSWLVPPLSGSATPIFHEEFPDRVLQPNFYYQREPLPNLPAS